ncbi:MAG: hypothetical protein J6A04_06600 [Clostridia bacterium]|nr:hypothetical protein [Clostridia bacterium]
MALQDNEKKLFIICTLFQSECGVEKLREFLKKDEFLNHSIIRGISGEELVISDPTYAQQHFSLTDTAFQYFVEQKATDGYLYASVESFKKLVGLN